VPGARIYVVVRGTDRRWWVVIKLKVRKCTKMSSRRDARGVQRTSRDDIARHKSQRANLHGEFENEKISCVYVFRTCATSGRGYFPEGTY
jgi:hypothetical protein